MTAAYNNCLLIYVAILILHLSLQLFVCFFFTVVFASDTIFLLYPE